MGKVLAVNFKWAGLTAVLQRIARFRQHVLVNILSYLYNQPMNIAPRHYMGVAAALVLYTWRDGVRHLVLVRQRPPADYKIFIDTRAKFVSCLGVGQHIDMASALKTMVSAQLGPVFARLLGDKCLHAHTVVAAPMMSLVDEDTGLSTPMQVLVWVHEIPYVHLEVVQLPSQLELLILPENALDGVSVSPTHRGIWNAVVDRHVPNIKASRRKREDGVEMIEESLAAAKAGKSTRIIH
jgi:hypothetical protein